MKPSVLFFQFLAMNTNRNETGDYNRRHIWERKIEQMEERQRKRVEKGGERRKNMLFTSIIFNHSHSSETKYNRISMFSVPNQKFKCVCEVMRVLGVYNAVQCYTMWMDNSTNIISDVFYTQLEYRIICGIELWRIYTSWASARNFNRKIPHHESHYCQHQ